MVRIILNYLINLKKQLNLENKILIYGINDKSLSLKDFRNYPNYGKVIAFIDRNNRYKKRELSGIKIFKNADFFKVIKKYKITEIIINSKSYSKKEINILYKKLRKKTLELEILLKQKIQKIF